jgi:hypothetical protein
MISAMIILDYSGQCHGGIKSLSSLLILLISYLEISLIIYWGNRLANVCLFLSLSVQDRKFKVLYLYWSQEQYTNTDWANTTRWCYINNKQK